MILEFDPVIKIAFWFFAFIVISLIVIEHHLDVLFFECFLQLVNDTSLLVIDLCPDLDSEHVLAASSALIEKSDTWDHVNILEFFCDDSEDKLLPEFLKER